MYRLNDLTVVRSGYGLTYDARPWAENFNGRAQYPLAINSNFQPPAAAANFGWYGTLEQGLPLIVGPDLSSGRVPLPNTVTMTTLADTADRRPKTHSWNVAFERRLPIASVNIAYVGNHSVEPYANLNANAVQHLGGGAQDRPVLRPVRAAARDQRADAVREADVQLASARRQPADDQGVAAQGAVHVQPGLEHGHELRAADAGVPGAQLGAAEPATAITSSRCRSCISCRGRAPRIAASSARSSTTGRSAACSARSAACPSP